jgi:hypothetical protein
MRKEAAVLYKNVFAAAAPTSFRTLKVDECPATFRMFNPQHVVAYRDGFGLALQRGPSGESGLYVVPAQMDVAPNPGRRARFERIAEGHLLVLLRAMTIVRRISAEETIAVRWPILRPGFPSETAVFDGDHAPSTIHFGAFQSESLVGVASIYAASFPEKPE